MNNNQQNNNSFYQPRSSSNLENKNNNSFNNSRNLNNNSDSNKKDIFEIYKKRFKERQEMNRKAIPESLSILFGMIIVVISYFFNVIMSENFLNIDNMLYVRAGIFFIIGLPILYLFIWVIFLKNIMRFLPNIFSESNIKVIHYIVIIVIIISSFFIDLGLVKFLNVKLDKNPPVKRFFRLVKKDFTTTENRKSHTTNHHYYIYFNSWFNDSLFSYEIPKISYSEANPGDIYKAITHKGYYGYEYYTNLDFYKPAFQSPFSKDLKFPITEEEGNKIIEEYRKDRMNQKKGKKK